MSIVAGFLIWFAGGCVGCVTGWLIGRGFRLESEADHSFDLPALLNSYAHAHAQAQARYESFPRSKPPPAQGGRSFSEAPSLAAGPYMVAVECILFAGTQAECADYLAERGIIPHVDAMEPYDSRLQDTMDELGVRVVNQPIQRST